MGVVGGSGDKELHLGCNGTWSCGKGKELSGMYDSAGVKRNSWIEGLELKKQPVYKGEEKLRVKEEEEEEEEVEVYQEQ